MEVAEGSAWANHSSNSGEPHFVDKEQRPRPQAAVRKTRHAALIDRGGERHGRQVVAAPPRPPLEAGPNAFAGIGQHDGGDELGGAERRHARADEELS